MNAIFCFMGLLCLLLTHPGPPFLKREGVPPAGGTGGSMLCLFRTGSSREAVSKNLNTRARKNSNAKTLRRGGEKARGCESEKGRILCGLVSLCSIWITAFYEDYTIINQTI